MLLNMMKASSMLGWQRKKTHHNEVTKGKGGGAADTYTMPKVISKQGYKIHITGMQIQEKGGKSEFLF